MNNTSMRSFGNWSLTFGLGYYLLAHLAEPLATKVDLAFIGIGILVLLAAWFRGWWHRRALSL